MALFLLLLLLLSVRGSPSLEMQCPSLRTAALSFSVASSRNQTGHRIAQVSTQFATFIQQQLHTVYIILYRVFSFSVQGILWLGSILLKCFFWYILLLGLIIESLRNLTLFKSFWVNHRSVFCPPSHFDVNFTLQWKCICYLTASEVKLAGYTCVVRSAEQLIYQD